MGEVELRRTGHESILRGELKDLVQHESYWNVMLSCKDGTLPLNRLTVGLIFPQLQDEISVICPDYTVADITLLVNKTLCPLTCVTDVRDMAWLNYIQPEVTGPTQECVIDLENDEKRLDKVHQDPLDQLCFDLAPYTSDNFITEPSNEVELIDSSQKINVKPVDIIDLTQSNVSISTNTAVKVEIHDPLTDILEESSDDELHYNSDDNMTDSLHHDFELHYTDNEIMVQEILDSLIDNLEKDNNQLKDGATGHPTAQVLFYMEASEYVEEINDNDEKTEESLTVWDQRIDKGGKCSKECVVELENIKLNSRRVNREEKRKKRIILERVKGEGNEKYKNDVYNDSRPLLYDLHNPEGSLQDVDIKVSSSPTPSYIPMITKTIEITPLDESKNKMTAKPTTINISPRPKIKRNSSLKTSGKLSRRCGVCRPCLVGDCTVCVYCLDMKKYGGKGVKKQKCMYRPQCQQFVLRNRSKSRLPNTESSLSRRAASISPQSITNTSSRSSRSSSRSVSKSLNFTPEVLEQFRRKESHNDGTETLRISAARQHLRDVESDSDTVRGRKQSSQPRCEPSRNGRSPFQLRVKDEDIDLKERLRRRAEGEWDRVRWNTAKEKQRKRTIAVRKAQTSNKDWPTKEELLFGFCVE